MPSFVVSTAAAATGPSALALPSPKRQRAFFPSALTLDTVFRPSYLHTRQKNLRCFPTCFADGVHMQKSFCGAAVRVTLNTAGLPMDHVFLFGEVHSSGQPSFQTGQAVSLEQMAQDQSGKFVLGAAPSPASPPSPSSSSSLHQQQHQYSFSPGRKWVYTSISHESSFHAYTVYLVVMGRIEQVVCSPQFTVIPIWTEQKRVKKAKQAAIQQQVQHHLPHVQQQRHQPVAASHPYQQPPVSSSPPRFVQAPPSPMLALPSSTSPWSFLYQPLPLERHPQPHHHQQQHLGAFYKTLRSVYINYGPRPD